MKKLRNNNIKDTNINKPESKIAKHNNTRTIIVEKKNKNKIK